MKMKMYRRHCYALCDSCEDCSLSTVSMKIFLYVAISLLKMGCHVVKRTLCSKGVCMGY
jgi:hypothetical protein